MFQCKNKTFEMKKKEKKCLIRWVFIFLLKIHFSKSQPTKSQTKYIEPQNYQNL